MLPEKINKELTSLGSKRKSWAVTWGWGETKQNRTEQKKQGYARDSGAIKRNLQSRLSIRNHLSQATSPAQWLMGLCRPWVPAHYLLHTELLFKHGDRNMKYCFLCCHLVQKRKEKKTQKNPVIFLFWAENRKVFILLGLKYIRKQIRSKEMISWFAV